MENWINNGEGIICDKEGDVCTNVRTPEIAKFIAAAPDMAETLKDLADQFDEYRRCTAYGKRPTNELTNMSSAYLLKARKTLARAGVQ